MADQPHDVDAGGAQFLPPPDFVPHTQIPTWIVLTPLTPHARSAHQFLFAHVDQGTGQFVAIPSMASIAKFLGFKTENGARKYVNELKDAGLVSSVITFWDRKAKQRTTQRVRADGVKNDQTSNTFQMRWHPPLGRQHPGPLSTAEWYKPHLIEKRIAEEKARTQRVIHTPPHSHEGGTEQAQQQSSQVATPLTAVGGPPSQLLGDPPHSCEGEEEPEEKNHQPTPDPDEAATTEPVDSGDVGWLESFAEENKPDPESAGALFLRSLVLPDGGKLADDVVIAEAEHASTLLASGWGEQELTAEITDGSGIRVKSWTALVRSKIRKQQPKQQKSGSASTAWPEWCGECEREDRRYMGEDGRLYRCPTCHPRSAQHQSSLKMAG